MSYSRQTQLTRRRVYNDRGRGLWPRRRQSLDWTNISADADERKGRRRRPGLPGSAANKPIRARIYRSRPSSSREIAPSAGDRLTTRRQAALLLRPIPMQNSQPMTQKKKKKKEKKENMGPKKIPSTERGRSTSSLLFISKLNRAHACAHFLSALGGFHAIVMKCFCLTMGFFLLLQHFVVLGCHF